MIIFWILTLIAMLLCSGILSMGWRWLISREHMSPERDVAGST